MDMKFIVLLVSCALLVLLILITQGDFSGKTEEGENNFMQKNKIMAEGQERRDGWNQTSANKTDEWNKSNEFGG